MTPRVLQLYEGDLTPIPEPVRPIPLLLDFETPLALSIPGPVGNEVAVRQVVFEGESARFMDTGEVISLDEYRALEVVEAGTSGNS